MKNRLGIFLIFLAFSLFFMVEKASAQGMSQVGTKTLTVKGNTHSVGTAEAAVAGTLNSSFHATTLKSSNMEAWALEIGARPITIAGATYYKLVKRATPGRFTTVPKGTINSGSAPARKQ